MGNLPKVNTVCSSLPHDQGPLRDTQHKTVSLK